MFCGSEGGTGEEVFLRLAVLGHSLSEVPSDISEKHQRSEDRLQARVLHRQISPCMSLIYL
jgi:hypothetical protein